MSARGFVLHAVSALKQDKVTEHERSILTNAILHHDQDTSELLELIEKGYADDAAQKARAMATRSLGE